MDFQQKLLVVGQDIWHAAEEMAGDNFTEHWASHLLHQLVDRRPLAEAVRRSFHEWEYCISVNYELTLLDAFADAEVSEWPKHLVNMGRKNIYGEVKRYLSDDLRKGSASMTIKLWSSLDEFGHISHQPPEGYRCATLREVLALGKVIPAKELSLRPGRGVMALKTCLTRGNAYDDVKYFKVFPRFDVAGIKRSVTLKGHATPATFLDEIALVKLDSVKEA